MSLQDRINRLQAATAHGSPLEQMMLHETILAVSPNHTANAGASVTHVVVFHSRREAILKPFGGQRANACKAYRQDPQDAVTHEVAAWRLAHALDGPWEQLVPTAVLRTVDGAGAGVLLNRREGRPDLSVLTDAQAQALAAAFWDALIGQQDRHMTNFRYDCSSRRLAAIDNAFAFARPRDICNASFFLSHRRSHYGTALDELEQEALAGLLDSGDLHGMRDFLVEERADALEARAKKMLQSGVLPSPGAF